MSNCSRFPKQDAAPTAADSSADPFDLAHHPRAPAAQVLAPPVAALPRPVALAVRFDAIPAELAAQPHWYLWNYRAQGGKWKKPPVQIDGTAASVTDLATSTTYALVCDAYSHAPFDGIGVLIEGEIVGIDVDHCSDASGALVPWAAEIVQRFAGTYIERSPSGTGIRIFAKGRVPRSGKGGPENRLEVYAAGSPRYLTVTGHRLGVATEVTEQQAALDWLFERFMTRQPAVPAVAAATPGGGLVRPLVAANDARSDDEVLACMFAAANGAKARRLFDGDTGGDHSAADMAFVCLAAFHTKSEAQLDRLVRRSGLMRSKWDEQHGQQTYGEATIAKALSRVTGSCRRCGGSPAPGAPTAAPQPSAPTPVPATATLGALRDAANAAVIAPAGSPALLATGSPLILPPGSVLDFEPLQCLTAIQLVAQPPTRWLVRDVLTKGGLGLIYGQAGAAKTFLAINLAAAVALGEAWFGHRTRRGNVLYLSCEGALRNRIAALLTYRNRVDVPGLFLREGSINLRTPDTDTRRIVHAAHTLGAVHGPVELVCIDTLARAIAGGDENSAIDMGSLIDNAGRIQRETGAAVLLIHHPGKDSSRGCRGHSSLLGAADLEITVVRDKETGSREFTLSKVKEGEDGKRHGFKLLPVDLGPQAEIDAEQANVVSCVVEECAITGGGGKGRATSTIPAGAVLAHRALCETIEHHGQRMPGTSVMPANVLTVSGKQWRTRFEVVDPLEDPADAKAVEARKKRFLRARILLQERKIVGNVNDLYWLWESGAAA